MQTVFSISQFEKNIKLIFPKLIKCTLKRLYFFYKSRALSKIKMTDIFLYKSKFINKTYQLKGDNLNNEKAYPLHSSLLRILYK